MDGTDVSILGCVVINDMYSSLKLLYCAGRISSRALWRRCTANLMVELQHREGWTVRATMRKSALMRCDDPVVLVTFENLTERLWMDEY
jgi:hypothetical protein